jgi:hypothetical protein
VLEATDDEAGAGPQQRCHGGRRSCSAARDDRYSVNTRVPPRVFTRSTLLTVPRDGADGESDD